MSNAVASAAPLAAKSLESSWTTPRLLRLAQSALWFTALVLLLSAEAEVRFVRQQVQTIGKDTAPSIVLAQQIRADLADLDAASANYLLGRGDSMSGAMQVFELRRGDTARKLVAAAENITYGDAERVPIQTMIEQMGVYLELIGQMRALHLKGDQAGSVERYNVASSLLHDRLLPAADALDAANRSFLDAAYADSERGGTWVVPLAGGLQLLVLLAVQIFLFQRTRRVFNVPLVIASAVILYYVVTLNGSMDKEKYQLKVAKEDAFESIHMLWKAKALAYDANAEESRYLLDPPNRADYERKFFELAEQVSSNAAYKSHSPSAFRATKAPDGFLEKEKSNITFADERQAAEEEWRAFNAFLDVDDLIRTREQGGNHEGAVALDTSSESGGSDYAFAQFDSAVDRTITINQDAFQKAIDEAFHDLDSYRNFTPGVAIFLAVFSWLGLRPRLREYLV
jgi:hypothetical protein